MASSGQHILSAAGEPIFSLSIFSCFLSSVTCSHVLKRRSITSPSSLALDFHSLTCCSNSKTGENSWFAALSGVLEGGGRGLLGGSSCESCTLDWCWTGRSGRRGRSGGSGGRRINTINNAPFWLGWCESGGEFFGCIARSKGCFRVQCLVSE